MQPHPQTGTLGGKSPRAAFAEAVHAGWQRMDADPHALLAAFAHTETRIVKQGSFRYKGQPYTAREGSLGPEAGGQAGA